MSICGWLEQTMARRYKSDQGVVEVMNKLANAFPTYGSVANMTRALNTGSSETAPVHPNRLHTLLNGDKKSGINERAFADIEKGLQHLVVDETKADKFREKLAPLLSNGEADYDNALKSISEELATPLFVCEYFGKTLREIDNKIFVGIDEPDWSWQDTAVERSIAAIRAKDQSRIGLIIPTGGGKTRIANIIALRWLSSNVSSNVTWVTHRILLEEQAEQSFLSLLREKYEQSEWQGLRNRMHFRQITQVSENGLAPNTDLFIIDEAHHAAAPSYSDIVNTSASNGLFLTATPNRMDELPIGIESIAYETTYRELIEKRCLVEPVFEDPYKVNGLSLFNDEDVLEEFAQYVLKRKDSDLKKILICVTRQSYAEDLYDVLVSCRRKLELPLVREEDIGFVHSETNSFITNGQSASTAEFLNRFKAKEEGVLISTAQLIGEGFDDPAIDSVFVTYASQSISHLMQVAGRALRRHSGKKDAKIIQTRTAKLEYYFNQKWLYQDIADTLRPILEDIDFTDHNDLLEKVMRLFEQYQVQKNDRDSILSQIAENEDLHNARIFLAGLPYYGPAEKFAADSQWRGAFFHGQDNQKFRDFFNDVSFRDEIRNHEEFLARHDLTVDSNNGFFIDIVKSANSAKSELQGHPERQRPYQPNLGTTYLININLKQYAVTSEADAFLDDCLNKALMQTEMLNQTFYAFVKTRLPLGMFEAFALSRTQFDWIKNYLAEARELIESTEYIDSWQNIAALNNDLETIPIHQRLFAQLGQLIESNNFNLQTWVKGALKND